MKSHTWVVMNDIQIPYEDKRVLWGLVVPFIRELKPWGVALNGDIIDNYEISDFVRDPKKRHVNLGAERRGAEKLMKLLAPVSTERWWIGGNHEDRYRRYAWNRAPELVAAHIMPTFQRAFKLDDYGFKWKEYGDHIKLGKLTLTHGFLVAQDSGTSAKRHFMRMGTSLMIGHTHRFGQYHKKNMGGDHAAYENGCLCSLKPEYVQNPDWQQGFSVVDVFENGMFNVNQIRVLNRSLFMWGGEMRKVS